MTRIKRGTYRLSTGYARGGLQLSNVEYLSTSGPIEDEFWVLLEYYTEIEEVGIAHIGKFGVRNKLIARKVFKNFQSYVRQAKSFYHSAKALSPRSASLLYYYSFLNLAKAGIVLRNSSLANKKLNHGLAYKVEGVRKFKNESIKVQQHANAVFPELYKQYFKNTLNIGSFNIATLFGYCTDISYQYSITALGQRKILPAAYCNLVHADNQQKISWPLLVVQGFDLLRKYPKSLKKLSNIFEEVTPDKMAIKEMLNMDAAILNQHSFFQTINTNQFLPDDLLPLPLNKQNLEDAVGEMYQVNYFGGDYDFHITLPYKINRQIQLDETIAIYLIMFYLSNLVRYKPYYLESLLNKKESLLIDNFVKFCPPTFLRGMISWIIGINYIIRPR